MKITRYFFVFAIGMVVSAALFMGSDLRAQSTPTPKTTAAVPATAEPEDSYQDLAQEKLNALVHPKRESEHFRALEDFFKNADPDPGFSAFNSQAEFAARLCSSAMGLGQEADTDLFTLSISTTMMTQCASEIQRANVLWLQIVDPLPTQ